MYIGLTKEQISSGTSIPHILFGRNLFGTPGVFFFALMSILASVTSFNSGLLNTSRFAYAMGRDDVLPRVFSRLHPDYATLWVAILALVVFALIVSLFILFTGQYLFIIIMAAALECFIYVVMALCVIRLRRRFPDRQSSFRIPGGYTVPVLTIVIFTGLLLGIFMDVSRDSAGRILFANYWVAVMMAGVFLFTSLYTFGIVPIFKRKAAVRSQQVAKRRPGRKSES